MKKIYPVIHVMNPSQTFSNVEQCIKAGVDGIFLISHGHLNHKELTVLAKNVKERYPDIWIGVNFLDINVETALGEFSPDMNNYIQGIWFDDSKRGVNKKEADKITNAWKTSKFNGELFGGVAFKYCRQPENLSQAVMESVGNMSVITTSGDGTGIAADVGKIQTMSEALNGRGILGIASGVDIENVESYLPFIDVFLVSTGISLNHSHLDFEKMLALKEKIKNYS